MSDQKHKKRAISPAGAAGILAVLMVWALWYNGHRTIGWGQTFNPIYWWSRWHGDDLYAPSQSLLLHGNRALPEVALTIDDGPHPISCREILSILQQYHVHATFFDVGENMDARPDLVHLTLQDGNEIGDHSSTHLRLPYLSPLERHHEINDPDISFCRITGGHLYLFRPPGMNYNDHTLATLKRMGYVTVDYTTASSDYKLNDKRSFIVDRTLDRVENGSIILLHDYPDTVRALPSILRGLQKDGYHVVTISEMIDHLPPLQRQQAIGFLQKQGDPVFQNKIASR